MITVVSMGTDPLHQAASRSLSLLATRSADVLLQLIQRERLDMWEDLVSTLGISREDRVHPQKLQAQLLDLARKQLGAEGAVLYLWDERLKRYTPRVAKGFKNIRRPVEYAREGYALGDGFVGQVADQRKMVSLSSLERDEVDGDDCLRLLRQQTHTRELTLCVGVPIEPQVRHEDTVPLGVIVFADGREGAGLRSRLNGRRGGAISLLAAQVSAIVRGQEVLKREDRMFFVATHQAKNPLGRIVQAVRAIEQYGPSPEDLDELSRSALEASHNVEQVLHVERAVSGRQIEPAEVDLSGLVRETVAGYRLVAEACSCELTLCIEPNCRTMTAAVYARGVLDNLTDNAIKYALENEGRVCVTLRSSAEEHILEISDNGPGLPPEVRQAMEARVQVRPRAGYDLRGGFGLGLFIVTSYANLLGWTMAVRERSPHGTIFQFRIPILPAEAPRQEE